MLDMFMHIVCSHSPRVCPTRLDALLKYVLSRDSSMQVRVHTITVANLGRFSIV